VSDIKKPIVAVITDTYSDYHQSIVTALSRHLAELGYGTLCAAGFGKCRKAETFGLSQSGDSNKKFDPSGFDIAGHIVLSGTIQHALSDTELFAFVKELDHLPTVSVGVEIPGISSVVYQEETSMEALMEHMTEDPKRQRFVFLGGFAANRDSQNREAIFRRTLEKKSIALDESLIVDCEFKVGKSYQVMNDLLKSGARFDAVVAANDVMAGSAIRALNEFGLSVPEDVIVSGFDGSRESVTMHPPLTTIKQDISSIAKSAVQEIKRLIEVNDAGEELNQHARSIGVDCDLIIRPSTGGNRFQRTAKPEQSQKSATRSERIAEVHDRLVSSYSKVRAPVEGIEVKLADAIVETLSNGNDKLPSTIIELLREVPVNVDSLEWWQFTYRILALSTELFPADLVHVEALATHVNTIAHVGSALWEVRTRVEFDHETARQALDKILLDLASTSSEAEVFDVLETGFLGLKISCAWMYLNEAVAATQSSSNVVFALVEGERQNTSDAEIRALIAPERIIGSVTDRIFVRFPLQVGDVQLGYFVVDPGEGIQLKYEAIAAGISQALRNCWQIADLEIKARGLREINESLSTLARFDSLTNLPNRKQFHEFLETSFEQASDSESEVGLLFFDLDGFKRINDTLGHSAGDHLLRIVAKRVSRILRSGDKLCRLGGDEFTVIVSECISEGLFEKIAERILEAVSKPCTLGNQVVNVSASIGMAAYPRHGQDSQELHSLVYTGT